MKCGTGSFNPTIDHAEKLAAALTRVGQQAGLKVFAAITDMNQPLGSAVGNALEVQEAIRVLSLPESELSSNSKRFRELCRYFGALALRVSGVAGSGSEALARIEDTLQSGRALEKARQWIAAQGGTVDLTDDSWLPRSILQETYTTHTSGCVAKVDAKIIGEIALEIGAGRKSKADEIDLAVGLELHVKVGDFVTVGQPLATIHAQSSEQLEYAKEWLLMAIQVQNAPVLPLPIVVRPA